MKAIQLEEGEIHVRDIDVPEPLPDQARVHLSASGVCHSDLHLARGDWMGVPRTMSLGHEGIGVVEALGFCGEGEAKDWATIERLSLGGALPINTSGGLLGEAYIHGMNGITESVRQIRGTACNQVDTVDHVLVTAGTGVPTSGLILSRA